MNTIINRIPNHFLKASRVGVKLDEKLIPRYKGVSLRQALCDGEDFELLFTLTRQQAKKLLKLKQPDFKPIGEIVEKKYGFKLLNKNSSDIG